jgi:DNA-binding beta-propeller fold protein YncE
MLLRGRTRVNAEAIAGFGGQAARAGRIGPELIASIPLPHAVQLVFWKSSAWVLSVQRSLTLTRIDTATNKVAGPPVPVGRPLSPGLDTEPSVMTAGPTGIWVLDFPRNRLFHLALP